MTYDYPSGYQPSQWLPSDNYFQGTAEVQRPSWAEPGVWERFLKFQAQRGNVLPFLTQSDQAAGQSSGQATQSNGEPPKQDLKDWRRNLFAAPAEIQRPNWVGTNVFDRSNVWDRYINSLGATQYPSYAPQFFQNY